MSQPAISVENLSKMYHLGAINRRTLVDEIHYGWLRLRGRDPAAHMGTLGAKPQQRNPEFWALRDVSFEVEPGGQLQVRVPDAEYIINSWRLPMKTKLNLLFGGQDVPQGQNAEMDESRRKHPEFFCHKYGWTIATLKQELSALGLQPFKHRREGTNCVVISRK